MTPIGVELARLTKRPTIVVDLKSCLGEVALFLGIRPRFTVLDAIENLHRLDKDFLKELVAKHKSGLDILAGRRSIFGAVSNIAIWGGTGFNMVVLLAAIHAPTPSKRRLNAVTP